MTLSDSAPPLLSLSGHSEAIKAAEAPAEGVAQAAAEGAAAGPQGAAERTLPERGGAVTAGHRGGRPHRRPGHTDVTAVNQSVLPLRPALRHRAFRPNQLLHAPAQK